MATVTGITAERAAEIENASVTGGRIDELGNIILTHPNGDETTVGNINRNEATANVRDYGAVGDGVTDDTAAVVAAVTEARNSGSRLFFPNGVYLVEAPILIQDTADFRIDMQGRLKRKNASARNSLLYFKNVNGLDATVIRTDGNVMNNQFAQSDSNTYPVDEAKHDLRIEGCSDVTISVLDSENPAGDSVYVTGASQRVQFGHISSKSDQNSGRNAVSLIDVAGFAFSTLFSKGTGCPTGVIAMPGGFDIEPNNGQSVTDVVVGDMVIETSGTCGLSIFGNYTSGGDRKIKRIKIGNVVLKKTAGVPTASCDFPIKGAEDVTVENISIIQDAAATNQSFSIDDADRISMYVDVPNSRGVLAPTIGASVAVTNLNLRGRVLQSGGHCLNIYRLDDSRIDMKLKNPGSGVLVVKQVGTNSSNVTFTGDLRKVAGAAAFQINGTVDWTVDADLTGWADAQKFIGSGASGMKFKNAQPQTVFNFSAPGTTDWVCPIGAKTVRVTVIGAGGGGGAGRRDAAGVVRFGGGGGAAGSRSELILDGATYAGTTLKVTVGAGGAGGTAATADATSGGNGGVGGWSGVGQTALQSGTIVNANGGVGGSGGTAAAGTAGAGVAGSVIGSTGGAGSNGSVAGGLASWGVGTTGGAGGGGGGLTAANVAAGGGGGGFPAAGYPSYTAAGAAGANGTNGNNSVSPSHGFGGGGGGASNGGAAGNGGNGGTPGGAGGGGGASVNGTNSGAGGNGANGSVQIIVTF